ncbi:radical SAM protein [Thermotalea metallivorans]|uniref:Radical SAM core domain-containing protein n=1 Tax=Thermotalea metallivorans TaxID=520762 RepID=A0A140L1U2_9FIRM|nr:radical SAM protein [Thermotalea metallivorans]KXG74517.1 hypothetical protein AN619_23180 [Thermotalea metallivorans]
MIGSQNSCLKKSLHTLLDKVSEQEKLIKANHNSVKLERLWEKGCIVDDNFNEEEYVVNSLSASSRSYNLTIITTYDCNMTCDYCFQSHLNKISMAAAHIDTILARIVNKIVNKKKSDVKIAFTGEEPLINFDFIRMFLEEFKNRIVSKYGITYSVVLITNGTLLNEKNNGIFKHS